MIQYEENNRDTNTYYLLPKDFNIGLCHAQLNQYEMNLIIIESTRTT